MSSHYTPDSWVPILLESQEYGKIYKVLAGWYGGFAGSNSWKLSSGIESVTVSEDGTALTMPQSSGSVYVVGRQTHMSSLMAGVYASFVKQAEESDGAYAVRQITVDELLEAFK